ncbi:MAG TPA: ATP-binding protein [Kofleriaceae bacterium]|nr:ATP-binding protein [Kofleriaceae bacterium]
MNAASLVELGERYWALGLPAAARSAFQRALVAGPEEGAIAARRLAEVALAVGDAAGARKYAAEVAKREPGPTARTLLGQAQLAAGELAAARMSFAAAIDAPSAAAVLRARARLGLAQAALAEGDGAGAAANTLEAESDLLAALSANASEAELAAIADREVGLAEDIAAQAAALGRGEEAQEKLDAAAQRKPEAPLALFRAALLAARWAHGDRTVDEGTVDLVLGNEAARRPRSRVVRLRVIERRLRRRHQDPAARAAAIEELEALSAEIAETARPEDLLELARLSFMLAGAYEDDAATAAKAEAAYRKGLQLRPGQAAAACRLALLILERGDTEGALAEIERALRIDAGHSLAWRSAARMLDATSPGLSEVVERLLDASYPGAGSAAGSVAPRLVAATAEVARGDVLAGVYAHGHRVKNLLGIIGSRTRSARRLAEDGAGELGDRLRDLERDVTALYEEWAQYLRSMQATGPTVAIVPVAPLVQEVVAAAHGKSTTPIEAHLAPGLPELRGDHMLLREALLNVVLNAAEACAPSNGQVSVSARAVVAGGGRAVEIVVKDTGPGIPRSELGRIFVPGFTTKETGSGVGLTIAERVVAAHHGRILVDSEEGHGTTITILLPCDLGGFAGLGRLAPAPEGSL